MTGNEGFMRSPYHGIITGQTGAGKTVVANALHAASDRPSVFFNTQHKGYVRGETIDYGGSVDDSKIRDAFARGATRLDVRPRSIDGADEHEDLTDLAFRLAKGGVKLTIVNDEVHEYGAQKNSSVHRLHKRGRSPGDQGGAIKVWSISQRYTSVERSCRTECEYLVQVGLPSPADRELLDEERAFPFDLVHESHDQQQYKHEVEGGEFVSRAFSVERNGGVVYGPKVADAKYAQ